MSGPLTDVQIRERMSRPEVFNTKLRIAPFAEGTKEPGKISYGLSSMGYDIRLKPIFKVFMPGGHLDPKRWDQLQEGHDYRTEETEHLILPPHGFALGCSVETFTIPSDVICVVMAKSTYARCGIFLNVTPLEPTWTGQITIEIANITPCTVEVHADGGGIGQVIFHCATEPCGVSYADKPTAMYQGQKGIVGSRV